MIEIMTLNDIDEMLEYPNLYISDYIDQALLQVVGNKNNADNPIMVLVGCDDEYYFVVEDNDVEIEYITCTEDNIKDMYNEAVKLACWWANK